MTDKSKAIIIMLLSALSFSFMGVTVKTVSHLPTVEAVFFRNLISVLISAYFVLKNKIRLFRKKETINNIFISETLKFVSCMLLVWECQLHYLRENNDGIVDFVFNFKLIY